MELLAVEAREQPVSLKSQNRNEYMVGGDGWFLAIHVWQEKFHLIRDSITFRDSLEAMEGLPREGMIDECPVSFYIVQISVRLVMSGTQN